MINKNETTFLNSEMWFLTEEHVGHNSVKSETKRQPTLAQREALSSSISILTMNLNTDRGLQGPQVPAEGVTLMHAKTIKSSKLLPAVPVNRASADKSERAMLCNVLYIMGSTVLQNLPQ